VRFTRSLVLVFALAPASTALSQNVDLGASRIIDLTHSFNSETIFWPTSPSIFKLERLSHGQTEGGYFYSANSFSTPEHGRIETGTIVLLRTGWSSRWPDRERYLGDDTPNDASKLRFPSFGEDAARLLVEERGVKAIGADVASIDYGQSKDFIVHRIAAARNVPGLENLTNLDSIPVTGAVVIGLPMKIEGGSGGPVRVIALVPGR